MVNKNLTVEENNWLSRLLENDFLFKADYIGQIALANIHRTKTAFYWSILFSYIDCPNKDISNTQSGVPIEMRVFLENRSPIQVLLHVNDGIVSELEVFSSDLRALETNFDIKECEVQILVDDRWTT